MCQPVQPWRGSTSGGGGRRYPHESQGLERQSKTPAVMPATIGIVDVLLASMSRKSISYHRDASTRPPHMVHLATRDSKRTLSGFGSCQHPDLAQHACQKRLDTVPVRFRIPFHEGPRGTKEQVKVIKMFIPEILIISRGALWRPDLLLVKPRRAV